MKWQKRARMGVAAFGVIVAIAVYATMSERQNAPPVIRTPGLDPSAVIESVGATFQQFRAARQDYVIEADRQLTYEDGATKFVGVSITVRQRAGRDFVLSGREAQAGEGQAEIELTGDVRLTASDGFAATADRALFSESNATVRVPGPVSFQKGRMTGSGVGMTYDQETDVLSLLEQARVAVTDESGAAATEFHANTATLARLEGTLTLAGSVHVLRDEQVLEADGSHVQLSTGVEFVTAIELRGNASVVGGGAFDSMTADDIDLDYTEDGATLERVLLSGSGAILMNGTGGTAGREFAGDVLDLSFAPDASLTRAAGTGQVHVALPGTLGAPARNVRAATFEATGEPGEDLTTARFDDDVEYREEASDERAPRTVRSSMLRITFADSSVTAAVFSGGVQFEEEGLHASGAEAQYDPTNGTLRLSGTDGGGTPHVADEQIEVDADVIDVMLAGGQMTAGGSVTTLLFAGASGRLPGLLQQAEPVNVSADTLDYEGGAGAALYEGNATLWQGATAIRADRIMLDRANADLVASGTARSTIVLDLGEAVGRAAEIRYDDDARMIIYDTPAPPSTVVDAAVTAQLSGPQGDIRARRIEVVLGQATSSAERLEAYANVSAHIGVRIATGDRLTYFAEDERYVMSGIATIPVTIVEECRETSGRTMTFFTSTARIIVDGREEVRTQSRRGASCVATP
jgi:LPS export ABC transporter protein LptC